MLIPQTSHLKKNNYHSTAIAYNDVFHKDILIQVYNAFIPIFSHPCYFYLHPQQNIPFSFISYTCETLSYILQRICIHEISKVWLPKQNWKITTDKQIWMT